MEMKQNAKKTLIDLLTTKYTDFDYSNWVAEFNVTVKSMVP